MVSDRKLVVLIGCGVAFYRQYLLEQLSENHDVWIILDEAMTWQAPFVAGFVKVNHYQLGALERAIRSIPNFSRDLKGIISWDERYVIVTADLAVLFKLPSAGSVGIRGCRDKAFNRTCLAKIGIQQPKSQFCETIKSAIQYAKTLSYPLVVKPRGMGGSIGVALVKNEKALCQRFIEASEASLKGEAIFHHGALIEEFIEGEEVSVDGRIFNGHYEPLFVARKSVGLLPHFEEIGHLVRYDDPLLNDQAFLQFLEKAHQAIKFENGITHTEVKLTRRGYTIIEINGRLGGDLIPLLATLATGLKPGDIAGQVACGEINPINRNLKQVAVIRFKYPDCDSIVSDIVLPEPIHHKDLKAYCVSLIHPGESLVLPPRAHMSRAAYSIAVGHNEKMCLMLSAQLLRKIKIKGKAIKN